MIVFNGLHERFLFMNSMTAAVKRAVMLFEAGLGDVIGYR